MGRLTKSSACEQENKAPKYIFRSCFTLTVNTFPYIVDASSWFKGGFGVDGAISPCQGAGWGMPSCTGSNGAGLH